jgi:hypothetical protein
MALVERVKAREVEKHIHFLPRRHPDPATGLIVPGEMERTAVECRSFEEDAKELLSVGFLFGFGESAEAVSHSGIISERVV